MSAKRTLLSILALGALSISSPASAEDPSVRLVVNRQDEVRRLPLDNIVMFSDANRKVSISLDVLASDDEPSKLAGTMVSVVDGTGNVREFTANEQGVVTIDEAIEGPHAVVASTETAHGSSLFVFQNQTSDAIEADLVEPPPARMTLLNVTGDGLIPILNDYLISADASPFADDELGSNIVTDTAFGYRVELGPQGELDGQILSVGSGHQSLAGTTIVIMKDGQAVARDVADAQGGFHLNGVHPGVHGLIAAGPAGYAAFAFEAVAGDAITQQSSAHELHLVSTRTQVGSTLPVVLIPPKMVPPVVESIRSYYPANAGLGTQGNPQASPGIASSGAGFAAANAAMGSGSGLGSTGPGAGGGAAGSSGFGGGFGSLGGIGAIGAIAAAAASDDDDDDSPGVIVSPSSVQ